MRLAMLGLLLCFVAPGSPAADSDPAKKATDALDGTWEVESLEYNGDDHTNRVKFKFVVKAGIMTVEGDEKVVKDYPKIRIKLDPSTSPKCVDLTILGGGQKDTVMEGIYEHKGDELRLCIKVLGNDRPTEFKSTEGSSIALLKLKR